MNISHKKIFNYAFTLGIIYVASTGLAQNVYAADAEGRGAKPNAQMQAVLDELAKLGPKPLGSLPAVEARKQPTPADAVTALLKKQGKSTEPEAVGKVENKTIAALEMETINYYVSNNYKMMLQDQCPTITLALTVIVIMMEI